MIYPRLYERIIGYDINQLDRALRGKTKSFSCAVVSQHPLEQVNALRNDVVRLLRRELAEMRGLKFAETLVVTLEKGVSGGTTYKTAHFNSHIKTIINGSEIGQDVDTANEEVVVRIARWISEGSGWTVNSVDGHYVNLTVYSPLEGSSYVDLPKELRHSRKGLINVKNNDDKCFMWCHLAHKFPVSQDSQRVTKYRNHVDDLDYSGISFPVTQKQYNRVEK